MPLASERPSQLSAVAITTPRGQGNDSRVVLVLSRSRSGHFVHVVETTYNGTAQIIHQN